MFNTYIENEDLKEKILDLGWIVIKEVWTNCPQSVYDTLQSEYEEEGKKWESKQKSWFNVIESVRSGTKF